MPTSSLLSDASIEESSADLMGRGISAACILLEHTKGATGLGNQETFATAKTLGPTLAQPLQDAPSANSSFLLPQRKGNKVFYAYI